MSEQPLLLPAPRELELLGGRVVGELPVEQAAQGAPQALGGYLLEVGPDGRDAVRIASHDEAGEHHARATVAQLRRQFGSEVPRLRVRDWPAFATRGYLLDISRGRVPDAAERSALVRRLANLKLNRLELYTEHTFTYAGHEDVWRGTGALTPDDVRALDADCAAHGIELVANQNCFGHFENWLRHPAYAELAETHERFQFEGIELQGPFSLCPVDPRSLELVRDLLGQLLPCFTSARVNLNCDETQDVGQGRSAAAVAERGAFEVYRDFVSQVAAVARAHGKRPQIWADVALSHPERLAELPADLTPIAWGYEPDHPFDDQARTLAGLGREFLLCCGTGAWRSWIGRTTERRANLDNVVRAGIDHGAAGLLIAEWGDLGHTQVEPIGRLGLAEFAARAWNPDPEPDPRAVSIQAFNDPSGQLSDWIAELGDVDLELRARSGIPTDDGHPRRLANANAIFEALNPSGFPNRIERDPELWRRSLSRIADLAQRLPEILADQRGPALERANLAGDLETALSQARAAIEHVLERGPR